MVFCEMNKDVKLNGIAAKNHLVANRVLHCSFSNRSDAASDGVNFGTVMY